MLERSITNTLHQKLTQVPAVVLLGARQVGKTTLAKHIAKDINSIYLDLESPKDLFKLRDPESFLRQHHDQLIILDEIQRAPELFAILRGIIDENREQGHPNGQFLLLGSASMELLRQSSESLAGRISTIHMTGLNALEIDPDPSALQTLWLRGGFPNSFLATSDDMAMEWLEDLIRTTVERDIPQIGFHIPATRLRRLWTMLAHLQGEPINHSKLATNLEIDSKTVSQYIDIFVDLLLLRRLEPWYLNVKKRLVKSPRYYIRDSGIQHRLLNIDDHHALLSNPALGKSWEAFVIENIHSVLPRRAQSYYYRTAAGAEIDMVLKLPSSETWAIEIKYGTSPKLNKHHRMTASDVGATKQFVVYGGDETFPIGENVSAISLQKLMEKIHKLD